ncbi:MAG TPA: oxidoreductase [Luteibacter sp.]|nr:oxidoreductase [Luteibacter sp.]
MPSPQIPLHSGFGFTTTASEALAGRDLTGRTAIVTGGYDGLNLEVTRVLAGAGATVIVPARTLDKARAALGGIPRVEIAAMDLMDPASIDAFAEGFLQSGRALDILVNGAGIMIPPLVRDARGNESQFSTNHLGHFQLTARLFPALRRANGARVVAVSSRGHRIAGVDFDDPNFERREYERWTGYGQSKTANVLFAVHLDTLGEAHGVRAFALHPGSIITGLARHMSDDELRAAGVVFDEKGKPSVAASKGLKTVEQGAATIVWCATSVQLDGMGGVYCEDVDVSEVAADDAAPGAGVRSWAIDPGFASRLWSLSERLTGVSFEV